MESGADTGGLVGCQLQVSEGLRKDEDEDRVGVSGEHGCCWGSQRIIETGELGGAQRTLFLPCLWAVTQPPGPEGAVESA